MQAEALEEFVRASQEDFYNPSAAYRKARTIEEKIQQLACKQLQDLQLSPSEFQLIYTSGATESNNSGLMQWKLRQDDKVYCNLDEHPSVVEYLLSIGVRLLPIPKSQNGNIDYKAWSEALDQESRGVVVSWVNGLSGHSINLERFSSWLKTSLPDTRWHLDGAQAPGKTLLSFQNCPKKPDSLTFSGHKMGGPKGIGVLIVKNKNLVALVKGGSQQGGLRAGTLAWPLITAFAAAWRICLDDQKNLSDRKGKIRLCLEQVLSQTSYQFVFPESDGFIQLINTSPLPADMVMRHLEERGVLSSTSSACSSKKKGPSREFLALGIQPKFHAHILRLSFPLQDWDFSVEEVVAVFKEVRQELALLFPLGKN